MNWQFFCDWLWAPLIAPCIVYLIDKLLSTHRFGRRFLRKLTLGSPKIAIIADHAEQHNISKSITSTGLFKEKNIRCETYEDTNSSSFNTRYDVIVIVFNYNGAPSNSQSGITNPEQSKAEHKLEETLKSFKTTDEPVVIFAMKPMNNSLFRKLGDIANMSICQARGRLTADIMAQLTAFNG